MACTQATQDEGDIKIVQLSNIVPLTDIGERELLDNRETVKSPAKIRSTRRARFLTQIDSVLPWEELQHVVETQRRIKREGARIALRQLLRI
jgi:hypothetical protein